MRNTLTDHKSRDTSCVTGNLDRHFSLNNSTDLRPLSFQLFPDLPLLIAHLKPLKLIVMPLKQPRHEWSEFERGMVWGVGWPLKKKVSARWQNSPEHRKLHAIISSRCMRKEGS